MSSLFLRQFSKIIILVTLCLMFAGANVLPANAVDVVTPKDSQPVKTFTLSNPLKVNSVSGLVQNFVEIFSYVVVIIAVLLLIWVGLQFILARGDSSKMKDLKEWLFWIIIGVAVVIGARVIVDVVINTLASSGVDPNTINSVRNAL